MTRHEYDASETLLQPHRSHLKEVAQVPEPEPRISIRAMLWTLAVLQVAAAVCQLVGWPPPGWLSL